jgi:protein-S-isoprenylcysteine O-methyltransferase Ste14
MSHLEGVSYAIFGVYLLCFLAFSAVEAKQMARGLRRFGSRSGMRRAATLFGVAFALSAVWPLVHALGFDPLVGDPIRKTLDTIAVDLIGHLLIGVGALVAMMSQMHELTTQHARARDGTAVAFVDTGPFAISRNPVRLGQIVLFAGLSLVFPGVVQLVLLIALAVAVHIQACIEERARTTAIGEPYVDYLRRVPRWLGTGA